MLDSTPFPVCLRLAAVTYKTEHIHLEKWLNENLNMYKDSFFEVIFLLFCVLFSYLSNNRYAQV